MAYRNGTYIAFHAQGTNIPIESDIRYYNLLKAWTEKTDDEFTMINSHEKNYSVRDSSQKETLKNRLKDRLRNSKNMVLIISEVTKFDTDWVRFEIEYAVDSCNIPIIVAYTDCDYILNPSQLTYLWPAALSSRINDGKASCIHIPFKKEPIKDAINQFSHNKKPLGGGFGFYSKDAYKFFGITIS